MIINNLYRKIWDFLGLGSNGVKLVYDTFKGVYEIQEISIDKITVCKKERDIAIYLYNNEFTYDALKNVLDHYTDLTQEDIMEIQQQFFNYRKQIEDIIKDGAQC
ncbi:MAG: hypothetical protein ACRCW1_00570 [Anaerotignaceae bacterium]